MTRRLLALLACAACSTPVRSHPVEQVQRVELSPQPTDVDSSSAVRMKPAVDLSGAWVTGSTDEPAIRSVVLNLECNYSPRFWAIDQRGDTVRAYMVPASQAQGIARPPAPRPVAAEGRISGVRVSMRSAESRYVLVYDSVSGHLRGTLNGAPFWAMRQERVHPTGCIPVP